MSSWLLWANRGRAEHASHCAKTSGNHSVHSVITMQLHLILTAVLIMHALMLQQMPITECSFLLTMQLHLIVAAA